MARQGSTQGSLEYRFEKTSFGRHQTFPLRYSWLPKGYGALSADPRVFESDDSTVELGVGKNMVVAIQYWLQAAGIADATPDGMKPTRVGSAIFDENGLDPYLEDEATIWLIHWQIATNGPKATVWRWFFNHFHLPDFSASEVTEALTNFARDRLGIESPPKSMSNDIRILLRMYEPSAVGTRTPLEDALDSPLSLLGLIHAADDKGHRHRSAAESRDNLPDGVFGFAVVELLEQLKLRTLPINELMYGRPGWPALGGVFRLTENALLTKLERLIRRYPKHFDIREQAGVHQLYRLQDHLDPLELLQTYFADAERKRA